MSSAASLERELQRGLRTASAAVLCLLVAACSSATSPEVSAPDGADADLAVTLFGRVTRGSHSNLLGAEDDTFSGVAPLAGAGVRVVGGSGAVAAETITDEWGGFSVRVAPGDYRLEVVLRDASTFTIEFAPGAGETWSMSAKVDVVGNERVLNAEMFLDADRDDESDGGWTIQITGRLAGDPDSGEERIVQVGGPSDGDGDSDSGPDGPGSEGPSAPPPTDPTSPPGAPNTPEPPVDHPIAPVPPAHEPEPPSSPNGSDDEDDDDDGDDAGDDTNDDADDEDDDGDDHGGGGGGGNSGPGGGDDDDDD